MTFASDKFEMGSSLRVLMTFAYQFIDNFGVRVRLGCVKSMFINPKRSLSKKYI